MRAVCILSHNDKVKAVYRSKGPAKLNRQWDDYMTCLLNKPVTAEFVLDNGFRMIRVCARYPSKEVVDLLADRGLLVEYISNLSYAGMEYLWEYGDVRVKMAMRSIPRKCYLSKSILQEGDISNLNTLHEMIGEGFRLNIPSHVPVSRDFRSWLRYGLEINQEYIAMTLDDTRVLPTDLCRLISSFVLHR